MKRFALRPCRRLCWALAATPLLLAACGSGSGSGGSTASNGDTAPSGNATLRAAGTRVQAAMEQYRSKAATCKTASSPVVCLEAADRTLGGKIHDYANVLAEGRGFKVPSSAFSSARDAAQTLANSLEILGDAEPTQSNYDQVLNTFNLSSAIAHLQDAVRTLDDSAN